MFARRFFPAALLFACLFVGSTEVRSDPIGITNGFFRVTSPFLSPPRYISFGFELQGPNLRAAGNQNDGPGQSVGSNCVLPCLGGSTFSLNPTSRLATEGPPGLLALNGLNRIGLFSGGLHFQTGEITVPQNAGSELVLTTSFTMFGALGFAELDAQGSGLTGFNYEAELFGSGFAQITLAFSQLTRQYEIISVRYDFQAAAVPEPATLLLLATGLSGVVAGFRKRKRCGAGTG